MRDLWWMLALFLAAGGVVGGINAYISKTGSPIYNTIEEVPAKKAALLLGTSKYITKGKKNYFYTYRIEAAVALWRAGKVKAIVVSGHKANKYYDEPTRMYNDLIKAGVPAQYIAKDYAGLRTLDSVMRAEAIFDLKDYIIISQRFHLERALFLAHAKGQKAIGFKAKDLKGTPAAYKMQTREFLAKTKAFLDVYLLGTQPKFYGEKKRVEYKK